MAETRRSAHGPDEGLGPLSRAQPALASRSISTCSGQSGTRRAFASSICSLQKGIRARRNSRRLFDIESNTLHYHLDTLVDVGLVENRKRKEPTSDGLYSYYRATSLGEGILEHGVRELMREEWELLDAYGESNASHD